MYTVHGHVERVDMLCYHDVYTHMNVCAASDMSDTFTSIFVNIF
jgi:hypothetical protein